jgi:hypothetical protein
MIAMSMEGYWGMGRTIASHGVLHQVGIGGGGRPGGGKEDDEGKLLQGKLGERIEANLKEQLGRVDALLQQHRVSVLALAHALETHKTLSGDDVKAVISGTPGPLIDGRQYYEPGFVERLEAYHAALMHAHKNHEAVSIPLPNPNGAGQPAPVALGPVR